MSVGPDSRERRVRGHRLGAPSHIVGKPYEKGSIDQSVMPTPATLDVSAVVLGVGMGVTTRLGFAHIAATTPAQRTGRTMGAAEV